MSKLTAKDLNNPIREALANLDRYALTREFLASLTEKLGA